MTASISYRLVCDTLAEMTTAAVHEAARFYGIDETDPRLTVRFLGARPARLIVDGDAGPDLYGDGIVVLSSSGWVGLWEADYDPEPPPPIIHAAHPGIHRLLVAPNGTRIAEVRADRFPHPYADAVTACGETLLDGRYRPLSGLRLDEWREVAENAGVTCESCLDSTQWVLLDSRPEP